MCYCYKDIREKVGSERLHLFVNSRQIFRENIMDKRKTDIDIVNEILEACILAYPVSSFVISLYKQYQQRGSLSKKQLQGLHAKASAINDLSPGKLATLEALIRKMPTRYKSETPAPTPLYEKETSAGQIINTILEKYPQHKRVLFLKSKYENNEVLTAADLSDLKRFQQLLK
jgi:hypothetical protein